MSSSPPCMFTSRACAFSMMMRPLVSCHLACTGTITGKRLPRRCSVFFGGGVTSSSTRAVPQQKGTRVPFLGRAPKTESVLDWSPGEHTSVAVAAAAVGGVLYTMSKSGGKPAAPVTAAAGAPAAAEKADPVHDLKILSARMEKD